MGIQSSSGFRTRYAGQAQKILYPEAHFLCLKLILCRHLKIYKLDNLYTAYIIWTNQYIAERFLRLRNNNLFYTSFLALIQYNNLNHFSTYNHINDLFSIVYILKIPVTGVNWDKTTVNISNLFRFKNNKKLLLL